MIHDKTPVMIGVISEYINDSTNLQKEQEMIGAFDVGYGWVKAHVDTNGNGSFKRVSFPRVITEALETIR